MSNTFEPLNKPDSTIQDAGLYQGQVLVIEQKNEDGTDTIKEVFFPLNSEVKIALEDQLSALRN